MSSSCSTTGGHQRATAWSNSIPGLLWCDCQGVTQGRQTINKSTYWSRERMNSIDQCGPYEHGILGKTSRGVQLNILLVGQSWPSPSTERSERAICLSMILHDSTHRGAQRTSRLASRCNATSCRTGSAPANQSFQEWCMTLWYGNDGTCRFLHCKNPRAAVFGF